MCVLVWNHSLYNLLIVIYYCARYNMCPPPPPPFFFFYYPFYYGRWLIDWLISGAYTPVQVEWTGLCVCTFSGSSRPHWSLGLAWCRSRKRPLRRPETPTRAGCSSGPTTSRDTSGDGSSWATACCLITGKDCLENGVYCIYSFIITVHFITTQYRELKWTLMHKISL